jgi:hypothetical protein
MGAPADPVGTGKVTPFVAFAFLACSLGWGTVYFDQEKLLAYAAPVVIAWMRTTLAGTGLLLALGVVCATNSTYRRNVKQVLRCVHSVRTPHTHAWS